MQLAKEIDIDHESRAFVVVVGDWRRCVQGTKEAKTDFFGSCRTAAQLEAAISLSLRAKLGLQAAGPTSPPSNKIAIRVDTTPAGSTATRGSLEIICTSRVCANAALLMLRQSGICFNENGTVFLRIPVQVGKVAEQTVLYAKTFYQSQHDNAASPITKEQIKDILMFESLKAQVLVLPAKDCTGNVVSWSQGPAINYLGEWDGIPEADSDQDIRRMIANFIGIPTYSPRELACALKELVDEGSLLHANTARTCAWAGHSNLIPSELNIGEEAFCMTSTTSEGCTRLKDTIPIPAGTEAAMDRVADQYV
jgi:hypothetical protein